MFFLGQCRILFDVTVRVLRTDIRQEATCVQTRADNRNMWGADRGRGVWVRREGDSVWPKRVDWSTTAGGEKRQKKNGDSSSAFKGSLKSAKSLKSNRRIICPTPVINVSGWLHKRFSRWRSCQYGGVKDSHRRWKAAAWFYLGVTKDCFFFFFKSGNVANMKRSRGRGWVTSVILTVGRKEGKNVTLWKKEEKKRH